jgi:hypothetical protein
VSLLVHAGLALLLMFGIRQAVINQTPDTPLKFTPVFLDTPGKGGGGGGNPAPAPPKKGDMLAGLDAAVAANGFWSDDAREREASAEAALLERARGLV